MKKSLFLASLALVGLSACTTPTNTHTAQAANLNGKWQLTAIKGVVLPKSDNFTPNAIISFDGNKGSLDAGCNSIHFDIKSSTNSVINISQIRMTKMACDDMRQEQFLTSTLPSITNHKINGNQLTLANNTLMLEFVAVK